MSEQQTSEKKVTVCSACLRASCWHGHFYCDEYKSAATVEKTVDELMALNREHWSYFHPELQP